MVRALQVNPESSVLWAGCAVNDLTFVRYVVGYWKGHSRGTDILLNMLTRPAGPNRRTPLMEAVLNDNLAMVELLRSVIAGLAPSDVETVLRSVDAARHTAFDIARMKGLPLSADMIFKLVSKRALS